jgi:alpha-2-macroglobulin
MAETLQSHPQLMDLSAQLVDLIAASQYLSTFEKGWLLRAASSLAGLGKAFKFDLSGKTHESAIAVDVTITQEQLKSKSELKNTGSSPVSYLLNVVGEPANPSQVPNNGFEVSRSLYNMSGQPVDLNQVKSGDLLAVVIKGECQTKDTHSVMVVDMLPAGFEIETVKFNDSYMKENFSWMDDLTLLSRVEKRDDRYMAAFDQTDAGTFVMTYFVRALNPGTYKYPSVVVESMYRPQFSARSTEGVLTIKP